MMKSYSRVLCLALLLFVVGTQAENKIVFTDSAKPIIVKRSNPVFDIILQSNPTTGYTWALKNYDAKLISPVKRKFYPPTNKKLVGAPGYEVWTFRVKPKGFTVPQLTSITLTYLRLWDEQSIQVFNFKVVTDNAD